MNCVSRLTRDRMTAWATDLRDVRRPVRRGRPDALPDLRGPAPVRARSTGQAWTTLEELRADARATRSAPEGELIGIGTEPRFAIGQRALLVPHGARNVLWDCITLLDDETAAAIEARGGLRAIAISHPHYYSAMVEWAHRFDCPVLLHEDDREWVMRAGPGDRASGRARRTTSATG